MVSNSFSPIISSTITLVLDKNDMYDVLTDHQNHNDVPKAPSADHLCDSVTHHEHWCRQVVDLDDEKIVPDLEPEEEELEIAQEENMQSDDSTEPTKKCTKCNSIHHGTKPTQLWFYPGIQADILKQAKQFLYLWLINECSFLECDVNFPDAQNALEKAMEEFKAKGCEVEDGTCKSIHYIIFSGYYPEHLHDMMKLVGSLCVLLLCIVVIGLNGQIFEDASTFHGTLKTAAHAVVASKYDLQNAKFWDHFSNQQGWWEYLESMVHELIDKCTFLHQGEDENVSNWTDSTANVNNYHRAYQITSITQHLKNYVFCFMVALVHSGTYFLTNSASHYPSMLFHWQQWWYVICEHI